MSYQIGFVMDQIAGHVTNYHNLRSVAAHEPEIQATWHEIFYYKAGGAIEQIRERLDAAGVKYDGPNRGIEESMYFKDPDGIQIELLSDPLMYFGGRQLDE